MGLFDVEMGASLAGAGSKKLVCRGENEKAQPCSRRNRCMNGSTRIPQPKWRFPPFSRDSSVEIFQVKEGELPSGGRNTSNKPACFIEWL